MKAVPAHRESAQVLRNTAERKHTEFVPAEPGPVASAADNRAADNKLPAEYTEPVRMVPPESDNIPAEADNTVAAALAPVVASAVVASAVAASAVVAFAVAAPAAAAPAAAAFAVAAFAVVAPAAAASAAHSSYCNSDLTSKFLLLPVFSRLVSVYLIRVNVSCNKV